jgi:hypothetical protein
LQGKLGPYRFVRLLSSGGQGQVYLGYDERLQRRVAIKIRPLPPLRQARQTVLREARLAARLDSPKIVQVYDVIESDTHLGMVMEYVPGCTLEDLLQAVRPSLASAVAVAQDLAAALTLARQQGVVHGDVKAANVLITRDGHAKLADFGISRRLVSRSPEPQGGGTLSAMAPERLVTRRVDHRSDLFALGILLYRMLAGAHPFYRDGRLDTQMLLEEEPPALADRVDSAQAVPGELIELVEGLLRKNPSERVDTTLRVRQVLLEVSRNLPVTQAGNLRREAAPYFRVESPQDMPRGLPGGFDRRARFHYVDAGGWLGRLGHWLRIANWWRRGAAALLACAVLMTPVAVAYHYSATVVRFTVPVLSINGSPGPADSIDRRWLLAQVKSVLAAELGRLDVIGRVDDGPRRTVYSPSAQSLRPQVPEEEFRTGLRCVEGICVFVVSRLAGGERRDEQAVLLADMPPAQWRAVVRRATAALFD